MRLHLLNGVKRDPHDDEKPRSAKIEGDIQLRYKKHGKDRNCREEDRTRQCYSRQDPVDVVRRLAAGPDPGTNPPCRFMFSATSTGLKIIAV